MFNYVALECLNMDLCRYIFPQSSMSAVDKLLSGSWPRLLTDGRDLIKPFVHSICFGIAIVKKQPKFPESQYTPLFSSHRNALMM